MKALWSLGYGSASLSTCFSGRFQRWNQWYRQHIFWINKLIIQSWSGRRRCVVKASAIGCWRWDVHGFSAYLVAITETKWVIRPFQWVGVACVTTPLVQTTHHHPVVTTWKNKSNVCAAFVLRWWYYFYRWRGGLNFCSALTSSIGGTRTASGGFKATTTDVFKYVHKLK